MQLTNVNSNVMSAISAFTEDAGSSNINFLKFNKSGNFIYGMEDHVLDESEQFTVESLGDFSHGFIAWQDGKPVGEEMTAIDSGRVINQSGLPDHPGSDGWKAQKALRLTNIHSGEVFQFKSTSYGGRNAVSNLMKEIINRSKRGEDDLIPVFHLESTSYKHAQYGKIFNPVFAIDSWRADKPLSAPEQPSEPIDVTVN